LIRQTKYIAQLSWQPTEHFVLCAVKQKKGDPKVAQLPCVPMFWKKHPYSFQINPLLTATTMHSA